MTQKNAQTISGRLWQRSYTSLIIANCFITVAFTMFGGLLPLYVTQFGGDNSVVGSMAAGFGIVLMLTKPLTGAVIDRTNRRNFLIAATALFVLNTAAYALTKSIGFLFFLRLLNGLTNGIFIVASSTLIALVVSDDRLEDAISYYRITSSLTSAAAPAIGTAVYRAAGFNTLFLVMTALSLAGLALVFLMREEDIPPLGDLAPFTFRSTFAIRNIVEFAVLPVAAVAVFYYMAVSSTKDYLVAFGETIGVHSISLYFITNSIFMLLSRAVHRVLRHRIPEKIILSLGGATMAAVYLAVPFIRSTMGAVALGAVFGLADGLTTPLLNAIGLRNAPVSRKGTASATFSMITGIGTSVGGDLWGKLSAAYGYPLIYRGASLTALAGTAAVWLLLR